MMDRWKIEFSKSEEGEEEEEGDFILCNIINNYFFIGVVSICIIWIGWIIVLNFSVIVYIYVGIGLFKMYIVKLIFRKILIKII